MTELLIGFGFSARSLPNMAGQPEDLNGMASGGGRPGDDFNARAAWADILERAGWRIHRKKGDQTFWTRPDKNEGTSATTGYCKSEKSGDLLRVFSSNAKPFEPGKAYSKFAAFTLLYHSGDYSAAARTLAANGYGTSESNGKSITNDEDNRRTPPPELREAADPRTPDHKGDDIDQIELPLPMPWPILRREAHHGIVGEVVMTIAPESEADPVGLLIQMLNASGNSIGRTAHARVEGDIHFCNMSNITVGKSGLGRKGVSLGRALQLMEIADPNWFMNCIASGMSSGEGLIYRVRDSKVGENADGEVDILDPGVLDKRLLVTETEFGQVLRNLRRESNTLSAIIRNAWDSGNISTLTKSPLRASHAHISIIAHITEPELHRYFDQVDLFNGFANRFLWAVVRRSKLLPEGGRRLDLLPLAKRLQDALVGARRLGELERADETRELWASTYPRLTDSRPGLGGIVTSRAEAQVLRLAVLYAALDCSPMIMVEHLHAALAVWDYCEESARIIFGSEERFDKLTQSILDKLLASGEIGMTRTDIRNALSRNVESAKIVGSLGKLLEREKVRFEKQNVGGKRPAERWYAIKRLRD